MTADANTVAAACQLLDQLGITAADLQTTAPRHTTPTWAERHVGYGIARAYAGHTDSTGPATTTYIKADLYAVATALAAITRQPHPRPGQRHSRGHELPPPTTPSDMDAASGLTRCPGVI